MVSRSPSTSAYGGRATSGCHGRSFRGRTVLHHPSRRTTPAANTLSARPCGRTPKRTVTPLTAHTTASASAACRGPAKCSASVPHARNPAASPKTPRTAQRVTTAGSGGGSCGLGRPGEEDREPASLSHVALDIDPAPVVHDDPLRDGEPEARSLAGALRREERLEDARELLAGNAGPFVL